MNGKCKSKVIQSLGYLDELQKNYEDPITHFVDVANKMEAERQAKKSITITLDLNEQIDKNYVNRKNYGCVLFSKIYHELEIDRFLNNARRHEKFKFNTEAMMRLLLYTRLMYPSSKRESVLRKDQFFDNFDFSLVLQL